MEELKKGQISNDELADWFMVSKNSLSKNKSRYLKKLEEYCDFTPYQGGVKVHKIYKPSYVKNKNLQVVREEFDTSWDESGLDTCIRVASDIQEKRYEDLTVQLNTTARHVSQIRNEKYGKPFSEEGGPQGHCIYILCKKDESGRLVLLSEEEEQIKKRLLKKWLGDADEKTLLVKELVSKGELAEEEAWSYYNDIINLPNAYMGFMGDFKHETGVQLIRGTLINKELHFAEEGGPFEFN